jgi:hypothetical protein
LGTFVEHLTGIIKTKDRLALRQNKPQPAGMQERLVQLKGAVDAVLKNSQNNLQAFSDGFGPMLLGIREPVAQEWRDMLSQAHVINCLSIFMRERPVVADTRSGEMILFAALAAHYGGGWSQCPDALAVRGLAAASRGDNAEVSLALL